MEVEVGVVGVRFVEPLHRVLESLLDRKLVSLLVDEVDEVEFPVERDLIVDVSLESIGLCRRRYRGERLGRRRKGKDRTRRGGDELSRACP